MNGTITWQLLPGFIIYNFYCYLNLYLWVLCLGLYVDNSWSTLNVYSVVLVLYALYITIAGKFRTVRNTQSIQQWKETLPRKAANNWVSVANLLCSTKIPLSSVVKWSTTLEKTTEKPEPRVPTVTKPRNEVNSQEFQFKESNDKGIEKIILHSMRTASEL